MRSITKIKLKTVQRAFWLVLLSAFLFGATMQVAAQINPEADETYRTRPIPPTPATQSILGFLNQDELNTIISPEYQQDCANLDSLAVGLIPTATWDGFGNLLVADPVESACAVTAFNNGNPRLLAEMLNRGNDGTLVSSIFALSGKIIDQRPASGAAFFEDKVYALSNLGTVNAQDEGPPGLYYRGTGFDLLRPIQSFWGWSVNIVYALLIFVIVIVAFGIMFRANLSGNLAVTLQSAIPNIALAMILVPLSYAITGLFIDGITVGVNVTHQFLIGPGSPGRDVYERRNEDFGTDVGPFGEIEDRGLHADDLRVSWLFSGYNLVSGDNSLGAGLEDLSGGVGLIFGIAGFLEFLSIGSWLIPIVNFLLGVLLLLTGLRIFAKLLLKYITFIIMPLVAPFVFAAIALPGSGIKIVMWYVRMMGAASLAFIAAYAMILLSLVFSSSSFIAQLPDVGVTTFVPPLTGIESVLTSFASGANAGGATSLLAFMFILVAFALYMLIPKTLDNIDEALGVDKSLPKLVTDVVQSTRDSVGLGRAIWSSKANISRPSSRQYIGQSVRNIGDKFRGRTPGEANTSLYRRAAGLRDRLDELELKRQDAIRKGGVVGNTQALAFSRQIQSTKAQLEGLKGVVGTGDYDPSKGGKFTAEMSWAGKGGPIVLTEQQVNELRGAAGGGTRLLRGGKLSLKTEGYKMTPEIINRIVAYSVTELDRTSTFTADTALPGVGGVTHILSTPPGGPAVGRPNQSEPFVFDIPPSSPVNPAIPTRDIVRALITWPTHPTADGAAIDAQVALEIYNVPLFLSLVGPNAMILTNKVQFKIEDTGGKDSGNITSNEVDIKITTE